MKTSIVTIYLLMMHISFSQTANATKQDWASGICYRSGTNYLVTITWEDENLIPKNFMIDSIWIDGQRYDCKDVQISQTKERIFLRFGYISEHELMEHRQSDAVGPTTSTSPNAIYSKKGFKEEFIAIGKVEELFYLAYP